jgi:hypothetical protein
MPNQPEVYQRRLRDIFWTEDRELAARVARLCVLFEDLRVEYHGARADGELPLDALSTMYRRFYFLRRSLVTLDEFCGALNQLNAVKPWHEHVTGPGDAQRRRMWQDAVRFFNEKRRRFATIRGDVGAHYPEGAAAWAVDDFQPDTMGTLELTFGDGTADAKLHFATELVGRVLLKTVKEKNVVTDAETDAFVHAIFDDVTEGWKHAVDAVHVIIAEFLVPRFRKAPVA